MDEWKNRVVDSQEKKLWKKSKEPGERRDKEEYKKAEKELKKNVRNAKKNLEKKVAEEGRDKPKQFFEYVNREKNNRNKVGPLKDQNDSLVLDTKMQAELLNSQYASVFTEDDGQEIP